MKTSMFRTLPRCCRNVHTGCTVESGDAADVSCGAVCILQLGRCSETMEIGELLNCREAKCGR